MRKTWIGALVLAILSGIPTVPGSSSPPHSRSIAVFHSVGRHAVAFDVCVVRLENVHMFRGRHSLISVSEEQDSLQTWCELSTAASAHSHVCPWRCTLPRWLMGENPKGPIDVAVQFVNGDTGAVPVVFHGNSQYKKPLKLPYHQQTRRSRQLVTSYVIGQASGEAKDEHPLIVWQGETARNAATRFVEQHKLGTGYISPLTESLRQAMLAREERRGQLQRGFNQRHIVLGASEAEIADPASFGHGKDWLLLSVNDLDVASPADWKALFSSSNVDVILAEHVFEHLTWNEALTAALHAFQALRHGGVLRLAVPDCFAPSAYKQTSSLKDDLAYGHKIRWTLSSLEQLLEKAGFARDDIVPLEFHSKEGFSYRRRFDPRDGFIKRSFSFDERGAVSLILDAVKPCSSTVCKVATRKFELQSRHAPAALPAALRDVVRGEVGLPVPVAKQVLMLDPTNPRALRVLGQKFDEPAWLHMSERVEVAAMKRFTGRENSLI